MTASKDSISGGLEFFSHRKSGERRGDGNQKVGGWHIRITTPSSSLGLGGIDFDNAILNTVPEAGS